MTNAMIATAFLLAAFPVAAETPSHGQAALRNLAVAPTVNLTLAYQFKCRDGLAVIAETKDMSGDIRLLQSALRDKPGDIRLKVELAEILDETGETNAAHLAWLDVEKLCRQRLEVNAADGLVLMHLGEAVQNLGHNAEAESVYRRAVLVSSNDWRCWAGLGNLLQVHARELIVPEQLSGSGWPATTSRAERRYSVAGALADRIEQRPSLTGRRAAPGSRTSVRTARRTPGCRTGAR